MKRRLTIDFSPRQGDLLAVNGFEHRHCRWMIGSFVGQAWVETFDLFAFALQSARDLHLDQALDSYCQGQQVGQPRDLVIVPHEDRINPNRFTLEPVVIAFSAPVRSIVRHTSLERNFRGRIRELYAPAQSASGGGDCLPIPGDAFDLAASPHNLPLRTVISGAA